MNNFNIKVVLKMIFKSLAIITIITIFFVRDIMIKNELKELETRFDVFSEKQVEINDGFIETFENIIKIFDFIN